MALVARRLAADPARPAATSLSCPSAALPHAPPHPGPGSSLQPPRGQAGTGQPSTWRRFRDLAYQASSPGVVSFSKAMSDSKRCVVLRRGVMDYAEAWEMQRQTAAAVAEGRSPHVLILLQHPPTYTLGVRSKAEHLLASEETLARLGARVHRVDRGGDVTFHGPGQIVGYPIFRLDAWGQGPLWYVHQLEAALIDALAALGIAAGQVEGRPGVWVGPDGPPSGGTAKVAAIGVRVSRGITSHGFALNVSPDLTYFGHIVPCGLADAAVTSVERLLGRSVPLREVEDLVIDCLGRAFGLEMEEAREQVPTAAGGL